MSVLLIQSAHDVSADCYHHGVGEISSAIALVMVLCPQRCDDVSEKFYLCHEHHKRVEGALFGYTFLVQVDRCELRYFRYVRRGWTAV